MATVVVVVVWCGVVWCGVVWCGVVWCGVVWCGVVWCGVVWCGVVWCGVVWWEEGRGGGRGGERRERCVCVVSSIREESTYRLTDSLDDLHFLPDCCRQ